MVTSRNLFLAVWFGYHCYGDFQKSILWIFLLFWTYLFGRERERERERELLFAVFRLVKSWCFVFGRSVFKERITLTLARIYVDTMHSRLLVSIKILW